MERIKNVLKKLLEIMGKDEMKILPSSLAFFLALSVIPIIALIGYIASFFSLSLDNVINFLNNSLPSEISEILVTYISGKGIDIHIGFSMIIVFIIASNGPHSLIITSNALYNIKSSSYLKRRLKALLMTFLMVVLFLFIVIVLAFGNHILKAIMSFGILRDAKWLYNLFILLKWPLSYILILFSIKVLFTLAPDKHVPSKYVNKGVQFTTIGWILVTAIYSFYIDNFANYDIFYGGLSNIIILMMWIFILAYILVIGIAINANSYHMAEINTNNTEKKEENNN